MQEIPVTQATDCGDGRWSTFASDLGWRASAHWPEQVLLGAFVTLTRRHLPRTSDTYYDEYATADGAVVLTVFDD